MATAQAADGRAVVEGLNGQIEALEAALIGGGGDTGGRARDSLRKAVAAAMDKLSGGGPEEWALAHHLRTRGRNAGTEELVQKEGGRKMLQGPPGPRNRCPSVVSQPR